MNEFYCKDRKLDWLYFPVKRFQSFFKSNFISDWWLNLIGVLQQYNVHEESFDDPLKQALVNLNAPIWVNNNKLWRLINPNKPDVLGRLFLVVDKTTMNNYKLIAKYGKIFCLKDFLVNHCWPTKVQFIELLRQNAGVNKQLLPPTNSLGYFLAKVNRIRKQIFDTKMDFNDVITQTFSNNKLVVDFKSISIDFQDATNKDFYQMMLQKPKTIMPLARWKISSAKCKSFLTRTKILQKYCAPTYDDVWLRLINRILITNKFVSFVTKGLSSAKCLRCETHDESFFHLFWQCKFNNHVWKFWGRIFSILFQQSCSWNTVLFGIGLPSLNSKNSLNVLQERVWHIIASVVLHSIWFNRNQIYFETTLELPKKAQLHVTIVNFASHWRFLNTKLDKFNNHIFWLEEVKDCVISMGKKFDLDVQDAFPDPFKLIRFVNF